MPSTPAAARRPASPATAEAHAQQDLRPRHLGAALGPAGDAPVRGARGRAAGRRRHRARGQAAPPGARLLRPPGPAAARRPADQRGPARPAGAGRRRRRHPAGRAQPHRPVVAAGRLPARRQRHPDPRGGQQPRQRGLRRHGRQQGPADAGQGVGRAASRPRSTAPSWPSTPAGPAWPSSTSPSRRWTSSTRSAASSTPAAAELPCHTGLVLLSPRGSGLGRVGADKQIRLVRGDRDAFGLHGRSRRAADRPRPAPRPRRRHRQPRRPRRHRQVGAGPVRRPRGGHGAPPAPQGRRLPAAVRRRRPGARLPARHRGRRR